VAKEPYPYYALWEVGCGASLVHDDILLTAAHCTYSTYRTTVLYELLLRVHVYVLLYILLVYTPSYLHILYFPSIISTIFST
jgi:hypothetical protein